jgi:hypothetical protein
MFQTSRIIGLANMIHPTRTLLLGVFFNHMELKTKLSSLMVFEHSP